MKERCRYCGSNDDTIKTDNLIYICKKCRERKQLETDQDKGEADKRWVEELIWGND